jgi:hypothetical protein
METTKGAPVETISEDCSEKAVDAEIAKITNEKWCASNDLETVGDVPGVTSGDADREEGVEV